VLGSPPDRLAHHGRQRRALDIDMRFPVPLERMAATTPAYTANRAVNAVPAVCAATPGIRSTLDLPQIVATLG
jgi:2,4-diaminopentanoate dehydrogenase